MFLHYDPFNNSQPPPPHPPPPSLPAVNRYNLLRIKGLPKFRTRHFNLVQVSQSATSSEISQVYNNMPKLNNTSFLSSSTSSLGPVSRRSRNVFGPGKPQQKSQTLSLQSCSFHMFLIWTNFPLMQSFMPIRFFVFKIRTIENGFAGPKRFWGFQETGPWSTHIYP